MSNNIHTGDPYPYPYDIVNFKHNKITSLCLDIFPLFTTSDKRYYTIFCNVENVENIPHFVTMIRMFGVEYLENYSSNYVVLDVSLQNNLVPYELYNFINENIYVYNRSLRLRKLLIN